MKLASWIAGKAATDWVANVLLLLLLHPRSQLELMFGKLSLVIICPLKLDEVLIRLAFILLKMMLTIRGKAIGLLPSIFATVSSHGSLLIMVEGEGPKLPAELAANMSLHLQFSTTDKGSSLLLQSRISQNSYSSKHLRTISRHDLDPNQYGQLGT
ncbi:hypothetical protein VNO77_19793 [Canavalia gladiata]|uniref:Uncharacterized protein n=1 Tax=Canavalia gladiata TaxID=3824 RepID=A0AAN9LN61_CANGL